MLADDGMLIVKLWYHLDKKTQKKRIAEDRKNKGKSALEVSPLAASFAKRYGRFRDASERAIRKTDTGESPWHVIEAGDRRFRDLATGFTLLESLRRRLEKDVPAVATREKPVVQLPDVPSANVGILDRVDLSQRLDRETYDDQRKELQGRLNQLAWRARMKKVSSVVVFEGWDAAGKGGAIRRMTRAMDARLFRVIQTAAPTDEEAAHHYLWRFWRHVPGPGRMTVYDRSWYGRVLVERVEGLARPDECRRAYGEINSFEEQLCEHGIVLVKFWLHMSPEEQLNRFQERERTPHKAHKITEEDWRNRDKWDAYTEAVNDMVERTSTDDAPWHLVAANDKRSARVEVLTIVCEALEKALKKKSRKK